MHGASGNADILQDELRFRGWLDLFKTHNVEVICEDGPHEYEASPQIYARQVKTGLYSPDAKYRGWCRQLSKKTLMVHEGARATDIQYIETRLKHYAPIHAIGGLSQGGLFAAQLAARIPSLGCYINICGAPWEFFPPRLAGEFIRCPSLHVISEQVRGALNL
jgi:hypothetical protein